MVQTRCVSIQTSRSNDDTASADRQLRYMDVRELVALRRFPVRRPRYSRQIGARVCLLQMAIGLLATTLDPTVVLRIYR